MNRRDIPVISKTSLTRRKSDAVVCCAITDPPEGRHRKDPEKRVISITGGTGGADDAASTSVLKTPLTAPS